MSHQPAPRLLRMITRLLQAPCSLRSLDFAKSSLGTGRKKAPTFHILLTGCGVKR